MTHTKVPHRRGPCFGVIAVIALSTTLLLIATSAGCASEGEREEHARFLTAMTGERLAYRAHAHLVSDGLMEPVVQVQLEARQLGAHPIHINYDLCGVRLALYRNSGARDLAWRTPRDQIAWGAVPSGRSTWATCGELRRVLTVHPGETFAPGEFSIQLPVHEILGDSLQAGYYLAVLELDVREGTSVAIRSAAGWLLITDQLRSRTHAVTRTAALR